MTIQNKGTKQLGRALAVVMTVGSLLGVIASPAMAADEQGGTVTWNLHVEVTNEEYCLYNDDANTAASWSPDTNVVYYDNGDNIVDAFDTVQTVGFRIDLEFAKGNNSGGCEDVGTINPSGDVFSSFYTTDDLVMDSLECSDTDGCNAADLLNTSDSAISGILNVGSSDVPEIRTGELDVQWVPSESNQP